MGLSNSGHGHHVFDYVIVGAGAAGAVLASAASTGCASSTRPCCPFRSPATPRLP